LSTAQNQWPQIGQLFVERGYVTPAQLESALAEQQETGERLGEILVKHGYIERLDLASALSTQWSWKDELPGSTASPVTSAPPPEESVEPESVEAPPEYVPLVPYVETPITQIDWSAAPELHEETPIAEIQWSAPPELTFDAPASASTFADLNGDGVTPPVRTEDFDALAGRVSGLEEQERLLQELQARLREAHEHLAAGEARLGALEAILAELSQAYAALNARLDAQTREIEDLRRVSAEQTMRITTAARALLG
jgi:uncharacterized coiled-coil protein SlyX